MTAAGEKYQPTGKEVPFGAGRFLLSHRLGNGSFGDIFEGYDKLNQLIVAVKLERKKARYPQLSYESKVYRVLHQPPIGHNEAIPKQLFSDSPEQTTTMAHHALGGDEESAAQAPTAPEPYIAIGIPQIYYYDSEGDYNIMVMEMCGPSLEDVFNYCHRRFSLKTVLMIADQLLYRIQYFHEKGFVHRDIKPENFVFGEGMKSHILYLIDYGLSKLYWEVKRNAHIPFAEGRPLTGTARYCSANVHRGYEQSRRDDLESIGFLLVYFLKGSLPWQGIQAKDQQLKTIKIGEKKISTPLSELCKGLPVEFLKYCHACRTMTFMQKPAYDQLRELFRGLGRRLGLMIPTLDSAVDDARTKANTMASSLANPLAAPSSLATGSTNSQLLKSPRTVAAQLLPTNIELSPAVAAINLESERGAYDWEFDWFRKREGEVREGLYQYHLQNAAETRKTASTTTEDALVMQSVSGITGGARNTSVSDLANTGACSEVNSKRALIQSAAHAVV